MGLNKKNGILKGVKVALHDGDDWQETGVVGWHLADGGFFIGIQELEDGTGYQTEITLSSKAVERIARPLSTT